MARQCLEGGLPMVKEALGALKTVLGVNKEALFGEVSVHDRAPD